MEKQENLKSQNENKDLKVLEDENHFKAQSESKQNGTQSEKSQGDNQGQNKQSEQGDEESQKNESEAKNLISLTSAQFDEENKVVETKQQIGNVKFSIFYIESLIDKQLFSAGILKPIENLKKESNIEDVKNAVKNEALSVSSVEENFEVQDILKNIFSGFVEIVFDDVAFDCPIIGVEKRSVEEPPNSKVIKGPREGFIEDIYTNIGLVRKRIKSVDLKIIDEFVGDKSKTQVSIIYIKNVAKPDVVKKIREKIKRINIDAIIDSYYIESFLEENEIKFFRRLGNTEKPDIFCAKILEGRVGILVDGSPVALTVPFILFEDLQSAEDYYTIPTIASFTRFMRFIGLVFAILIPGIYVSLQSYNYRILPINFLITLLSSIEGLSVPPLVEILLVLFLFEIITEASVRMPNPLGMALSIIGALALGNTAVDAGIISPPSIVIVAISSVALYIIPDQISETRILRVLFTFIGGIVGLYGITVGMIMLTTFLCSIESFGVPYMSPLAPSIKSDKKDAFVKQAVQNMKMRPKLFAWKNKIRQGDYDDDE